MTVVSILVFVLVLFILWYVIKTFLPAQMQTIALAVVGICALIYLATRLFPSLLSLRIGS